MLRSTAALALFTLGFLSCDRGSSESQPRSPAIARGAIEVRDGQAPFTLQPYDNGYRILDAGGQRLASLRVRPDRVKAKDTSDQEITQAGRRDYGFKLKDADETTAFKARRSPGGFELVREDGTPFGQVAGATAVVGSERVTVISQGGSLTIQRGGVTVATVSGPVTPEAAVFLGLPGLTIYHRLTAMIYVMEVG